MRETRVKQTSIRFEDSEAQKATQVSEFSVADPGL